MDSETLWKMTRAHARGDRRVGNDMITVVVVPHESGKAASVGFDLSLNECCGDVAFTAFVGPLEVIRRHITDFICANRGRSSDQSDPNGRGKRDRVRIICDVSNDDRLAMLLNKWAYDDENAEMIPYLSVSDDRGINLNTVDLSLYTRDISNLNERMKRIENAMFGETAQNSMEP